MSIFSRGFDTQASGVIPEGFVQALVDYAEAIGDVTPLEEERDALFAKMQSGTDSKSLESASVNGKNFGWQVTMTLEEKFSAFVRAIKSFQGKVTPLTYAVFPNLIR